MFAGLINQAKSVASHLILKYVARASVALPFVIAAGFALAAVTVMLVERFGHVMAYWLVAGGLALIGVIASIVVSVKEHEEEVAEQQATKTDTEEAVSDATTQALMQTPIALLGALMTMPGGVTGALSAVRLLARNLPLVLLLVMIGILFWPTKEGEPRFEGKPMWQSFLPEADAALAAADIDPLIALLRQIETHAAVPEALRDQAAAVLRGYAAGRRTSVRKAKTLRHQTNAPGTNL